MSKNVVCSTCNKEFVKFRRYDAVNHFCSSDCHRTFNVRTQIKCLKCGTLTTNEKFCSKSCANSYNNVLFPKRQKAQRFCKKCNTKITDRHTVCIECNSSIQDWSKINYGEIKALRSYQKHSRIRNLARNNYLRSAKPKECICGYNKHVEICHIKPINSFTDDTPVSTINSLNNLVALCPNCHWELDHGLLKL